GDGITSEAIRKGCTSTTRYSWRAFSDVSEKAGLILLWDDGAESLVVPARALADEAARDFVTLARERIAQAAAAGDLCPPRERAGLLDCPQRLEVHPRLWLCQRVTKRHDGWPACPVVSGVESLM